MRRKDNKLTFSIRKLTIGAVSVMFGALIFGVSTTQVHADEINGSEQAQTEEAQQKQDDVAKSDAGDAQNQNAETQSKNTDTTKVTKTETPAQPAQFKVTKTEETNTLDLTKTNEEEKSISAAEMGASLARDIDPVNINDWDYSNLADGNVEVSRKNGVTYVGDIVVPNTADLIKAGKITVINGKAYVDTETLHHLTTTRGVKSITISKNDSSKLYVKPGSDGKASLHYAFANFDGSYTPNPDLQKLDVGALDTSNVTNMAQMIELNTNLTEIDGLENWNTSNVIDMTNAFWGNPKLTSEDFSGLSNWDTSNVTSLFAAFHSDAGLTNLDFLKNWKTSRVTDMLAAFMYNSNLTDVSGIAGWDVSNVNRFDSMFLYDDKLQLADLNNWEIKDSATTNTMFYPRDTLKSTPLLVIVKSGAENINKGNNVFGADNYKHYLYKVEVNGQIIEAVPAKAFNSAEEAVTEIQNHLNEIATSRNLNRAGYTLSWQPENQYGNTAAYQLYIAKWTANTPSEPDTSVTPVTPVQPTNAPVEPDTSVTPVTPVRPTNTPVEPEDKPGKSKNNKKNKNNTKTVKPHAEKKVIRHGNKFVPAAAVKNTKAVNPQPVALNTKQNNTHPEAAVSPNKPQDVVLANKKQNQKALPQTGAKESTGILGFLLASLGLFGFAADRKRKNN